jgi:hypothetical protein
MSLAMFNPCQPCCGPSPCQPAVLLTGTMTGVPDTSVTVGGQCFAWFYSDDNTVQGITPEVQAILNTRGLNGELRLYDTDHCTILTTARVGPTGIVYPEFQQWCNTMKCTINWALVVCCPSCPPEVQCKLVPTDYVVMICNSNGITDDNFNCFLNNQFIISLDLSRDGVCNGVWLTTDPTITPDKDPCYISNCCQSQITQITMSPGLLNIGGDNTLRMVKIQDNKKGNLGLVNVMGFAKAPDWKLAKIYLATTYWSPTGAPVGTGLGYNGSWEDFIFTLN